MTRADLDEFVACYRPGEPPQPQADLVRGDARTAAGGRYTYDEILARDKVSLDLFWLRDESLEDSAQPPRAARAGAGDRRRPALGAGADRGCARGSGAEGGFRRERGGIGGGLRAPGARFLGSHAAVESPHPAGERPSPGGGSRGWGGRARWRGPVGPQENTICRIAALPSVTATGLPRGSKFSGSLSSPDRVSYSTWPSISPPPRCAPRPTSRLPPGGRYQGAAVRADVRRLRAAVAGRGAGWVLAWYLIALQTLVEPTFYQRCFAARSPRVAQLGILAAIGCFALFDGLTTFTGMCARALLPALPSGVDAFPALGEALLPAGLLGLFYAGMLATVMSTVDSFLLVGGVTIGRDLAWRLSGGQADQLRWSRIGVVLSAAVAAGIALASESVVALWYGFGSVGTAVLLFPLLGALYPRWRSHPRLVAPAMLASGGVTLGWLLAAGPEGPALGVEPIVPGLGVAAVAAGVGWVVRRAGA